MPYKDPERKRQWEQDHREERNARRRASAVPARVVPILRTKVSTGTPDPSSAAAKSTREIVTALRTRKHVPTPAPQPQKGPTVLEIAVLVFTFALLVLGSLVGANVPPSDAGGPSS